MARSLGKEEVWMIHTFDSKREVGVVAWSHCSL